MALVLAMVMTAGADNCGKVDDSMVLKTTLPQYCSGGSADSCTADSCGCANCCKPKADTCRDKMLTETCAAGKMYDDSKKATAVSSSAPYKDTCCKTTPTAVLNCINTDILAKAMVGNFYCAGTEAISVAKATNAVKADASDYKAQCCETKVKCGTSFTCSTAGMKVDTAKATTDCSVIPCDESDCCMVDTTKCLGVAGTCDAGKFRDPAKAGDAATAADFKDKCCSALATCADFKASTKIGTTSASTRQHAVTLSLVLAGVAAMAKSL